MKRETVLSTIAYGANTPVANVSRKTHGAENIFVRARIGSEGIDGKRRTGLAKVTGGREIQ